MTPEELGILVRQTWVDWALFQPEVKLHPNWLTPWEKMSQRDRQVDILIGQAVSESVLKDFTKSIATLIARIKAECHVDPRLLDFPVTNSGQPISRAEVYDIAIVTACDLILRELGIAP